MNVIAIMVILMPGHNIFRKFEWNKSMDYFLFFFVYCIFMIFYCCLYCCFYCCLNCCLYCCLYCCFYCCLYCCRVCSRQGTRVTAAIAAFITQPQWYSILPHRLSAEKDDSSLRLRSYRTLSKCGLRGKNNG